MIDKEEKTKIIKALGRAFPVMNIIDKTDSEKPVEGIVTHREIKGRRCAITIGMSNIIVHSIN